MKQISTHQVYVQLTLFPETPEEKQASEIAKVKSSQDKLRKSIFARMSEQNREIKYLKQELELLKSNICKYVPIHSKQEMLF